MMLEALFTRPKSERQRIREEIDAEQAAGTERLAQLTARIEDAREREARARDLLAAASAARGEYEAERLALSSSLERCVVRLQQKLVDGAPVKLEELIQDISLLAECARWKADSKDGRGYEDLAGRRPIVASTNTTAISALIEAAGRAVGELQAEQQAESPDVERLAPLAAIEIPEARFQRALRPDDAGGLVSRILTVPLALAEMWAAITDAPPPKPLLSPGAARFIQQDAERANERRWNSGEAWR
jgi:hypothetical protein